MRKLYGWITCLLFSVSSGVLSSDDYAIEKGTCELVDTSGLYVCDANTVVENGRFCFASRFASHTTRGLWAPKTTK